MIDVCGQCQITAFVIEIKNIKQYLFNFYSVINFERK